MSILPHVFKTYDIRGLSPGELDRDFAYRLGQAFVHYTGAKKVVVGKDTRATTPELSQALIEGLRSQGANVIDVGLVTTPMFYFAVANYPQHDAGIMVTASHNPAQYNGFKPVRSDGIPIASTELQELRVLVEKAPFENKEPGNLETLSVNGSYLEKITKIIDSNGFDRLRVAIDAGNGMAGVILPGLFERTGLKNVKELYFETDSTFPNHEANPIKEETLVDLRRTVKEISADLGIAFDGDGDRIGFIDEKGDIVPSDLIGALLVPEILQRYPGAPILYDVRVSSVIRDEIIKAGGVPVMTPVGHGLIKPIMKQKNAAFGIELTGHFYLRDFFGVDCTDLVMLMVIQQLVRTGKKLSELIAPLCRYFYSSETNFEVHDKTAKIRQFEENYGKRGVVSKIDGIRIDFPDWWFSVRSSNTEPLLRLNVEAKSESLMKEKTEELSQLIRQA